MFKAILTALVYGYTIIIMLGMGASIDIDVPAEIKKSPKAILCGVASQYMFMPLITWGLICAFDLGDTEALSLMLCGMSPGGVTSTFFTYVSRANVTLSLLMTTCSTFLALGMMPLLIFVYVRPPLVDDDAPKMNYLAIVVTLLVATTPAVLGWRLRRSREGAGKATETWATRIGQCKNQIFAAAPSTAWRRGLSPLAPDSLVDFRIGIGAVLLVAACVLALLGVPSAITPSAFAVMALMCPVGFLLGYGFAKVVIGADARTARTVSMETGIQQVGIAGAIAIQTFKGQALDKAIATIAVFGIFTVAFGLLWSGILRFACAAPEEEEKAPEKPPFDDESPVVITA